MSATIPTIDLGDSPVDSALIGRIHGELRRKRLGKIGHVHQSRDFFRSAAPMKISMGATMRGVMRRKRDLLRGARDLALIALDAPVLFALRAGRRERSEIRTRVAIFNMHGGGDLLLSLPCLKRLREEFPADRYALALFCGPLAMELAALYAPVDHLVAVDRRRLVRSVRYRISMVKMIARGNFAVALQPTFNRMLAVEDALMHATGAEKIFGSAGSPMFAGRMASWLADRW